MIYKIKISSFFWMCCCYIMFLIFIFSNVLAMGISSYNTLTSIKFNETDLSSLQRGANIFFENCVGCHSLKYMRYKSLAEGLGIFKEVNGKKEILNSFIEKNWTFNVVNVNSSIITTLDSQDSVKWFGKVPPDLSLISRFRGTHWLYNYLNSFYYDSEKIWKVNNFVFPDVAMPHVLLDKQGLQEFVQFEKVNLKNGHLILSQEGLMTDEGYKSYIYDLVNFLNYVGEPIKRERIKFGYIILPVFLLLTVFSFFLKQDFWSLIKKNGVNSK